MRIDHIGYAVKDLSRAKKTMSMLGYVFGDTVEDQDRKIYIAFGEKDSYRVELVAPMSAGSPVDTILKKSGPTAYHICYKSKKIEQEIEQLMGSGFKVMIPLSPAKAFDNKQVVFMYSLSIGMIEIVEQ